MTKVPDLTPDEWRIVRAVLLSDVVRLEIGAENWDLSEADETKLWTLIEKLRRAK
jgi:hypothetical protein